MSRPDVADIAAEITRFDEPWQAQVFAMTTLLHDRGLFTWSEWTELLGAELKAGRQVPGNDAYFEAWLIAFEKLLVAKGITDSEALAHMADDWLDAAARTPHGMPIELLGQQADAIASVTPDIIATGNIGCVT